MNWCDNESLAYMYIACILQQLLQTPLAVLIEIYFEVMRTLLAQCASSNYFVHTIHCCMRPDLVAVVVF